MVAYFPDQENDQYNNFIYVYSDYFSFGTDEPAIVINKDLKGHTNKSKTFGCPNLNNKKDNDSSFSCIKLEVYALNFY